MLVFDLFYLPNLGGVLSQGVGHSLLATSMTNWFLHSVELGWSNPGFVVVESV